MKKIGALSVLDWIFGGGVVSHCSVIIDNAKITFRWVMNDGRKKLGFITLAK